MSGDRDLKTDDARSEFDSLHAEIAKLRKSNEELGEMFTDLMGTVALVAGQLGSYLSVPERSRLACALRAQAPPTRRVLSMAMVMIADAIERRF